METSRVEKVADLQLNQHTCRTIVGKPFPPELGPSLPPDNAQRIATVEEVLKADKTSNAATRPVLELLCKIMQVETAAVTLLTDEGTLIKEGVGLMETGKLHSLSGVCQWTLVPEKPQAMVVEDMRQDARTSTKWVVTGAPWMQFYAAAPLLASNGHRLGTLCIWDKRPRSFDSERVALLCNFSELLARELEASAVLLSRTVPGTLRRGTGCYRQAYLFVDVSSPGWQILHANQAFCERTGICREEALDTSFWDLFATDNTGATDEPWKRYTEEMKSRQSVVLDSLQRRGGNSAGQTGYTAVLRPASTDQIDRDAMMIGIPSGSLSADGATSQPHYCFVVLDNAEPVALQARSASMRALRLGPLLGAGTYGRVYRGVLGREKVAVKVVDMLSSFAMAGNLPLEAALMQGLRHTCIVVLLEHKIRAKHSCQAVSPEVSHQLWLVLQYCDRGSLEEAVDKGMFRTARTPTADPCMPTILRTALEIAQGLAFLHSHDILHCDISSANVLLHSSALHTHGFAAKVADFGACMRTGTVQPQGEESPSVRGTFTHTSPEIIDGQPYSKASDVYSFGVLLFEMYCGQHPWAGLHEFQVVHALMMEKQSLQIPDRAPPAFALLASRCMSREAGERPSIEEVVSVLEAQIAQLEA